LEKEIRSFSREFKLAALQRMLAGENVAALARELGIRRKHLYLWRERFRAGGPEALIGQGRPRKGSQLGDGSDPTLSAEIPDYGPGSFDDLAKAQRRIAELERTIGRQQVNLDFFQRALRHVGDALQQSGKPGETASTRSSKK
jgi:hypothetical protein